VMVAGILYGNTIAPGAFTGFRGGTV